MKPTDGLLVTAVVLGVLIALAGLVDDESPSLDDATAALVNETRIPTDELRSLLERRAQEGAPVDQLLDTLDDMIDEELLIQRASELGLLRRDSNVRIAIIQAMEKAILNEERSRNVPDVEISAFYNANKTLFAEPLTIQLEGLVVSDRSQLPSTEAALREGVAIRALAAENSGVSVSRLPPVPFSLDKLARRFPEEVVTFLQTAEVGSVLGYEAKRGYRLIRVAAVNEARVPPFKEVRLSVRGELQLQRQDLAYDEYLEWLRQRAEIRKNLRVAP
ncbi:peptidyl-prolyl cis-trans isomerase [Congregibacter sp.]|uniref:peptidylprolyl isomerase n=1 Tax=Congregibacter sp. TaxID=2744308 RepID=UPI003F6B4DD0